MNSLNFFLNPKSIAVIGASSRPFRAGNVIMKNLLQGGFNGIIMPVTPNSSSVCGVLAYPSIDALPVIPDIALLCTHASRNIEIFKQLASKGASSVIVLSSDMYRCDEQGIEIQQQCAEIAKSAGIRILGPNSLGIILPWLNFNASFSPVNALKGNIAFVSQSAAVCTTVLDWANDKQIGFSAFISLGNACDIDFADLLDYFCTDKHTDAILLYIDSIKEARRFMSAARAASRNRRILVLKSGKTSAGRKAAQAHTGGNDTLDIIYDSAIRRSGMLRVHNTHELFAAVETLTHPTPLQGERLAIITNGGGPAIMAVDTLLEYRGKLAELEPDIYERLDHCLPDSWSKNNPIDLVGDADHTRYVNALTVLLDSDNIDAILIMHSPSAIAHSDLTAQAIVDTIKNHPRKKRFNILTNWSGELTARSARQIFTQAGIPTYRTPESAVVAFMHLVEYRRNQKVLMETPTTADPVHASEINKAKQWIEKQEQHHSKSERLHVDMHQVIPLFQSFNLTALPTWATSDIEQTLMIARHIGYPVAIKLRSPDIVHKSEIQGVMLNLRDENEVNRAAQAIIERTNKFYPDAYIEGFVVQKMAKLVGGEELRVKVKHDATFGPVILIGQGGIDWDESLDAEAALPPLNMTLARYLVRRAEQNRKIRFQTPLDPSKAQKLYEFLVRISQMIIECPQIHELNIHPLLINDDDFTILDANLILKPYQGDSHHRLAIRPYPSELEENLILKNDTLIKLRPILPEDEPKHADFVRHVSKEDLYNRFFADVGEFNHEALANFTQIDYDREMAFVAVKQQENSEIIIGVSRALIDPENRDAEFAILIRSDLKGIGLGKILLQKIMRYCDDKGVEQISGITMPTNHGMLGLAKSVGFNVEIQFEDGIATMEKRFHL